MKKSYESHSSENIHNIRRAVVLLSIYPILVLLLTGVVIYSSYRNGSSGLAQQAATTTVTPETVVSGLDTIWSLQFAPDGKLYFTERKGVISVYSGGQVKTVATLTQSVEGSEEGLQGIALHPNFASNGWLYAYYTYNNGGLKNRLVRLTLNPSTATVTSGPVTLIDNIPGYRFHNGGRIQFGPDGKLYITTGAATPDTSSQDKSSLAGKILRVNDDGTGVSDNPFSENKRVYSYGHRNPQSLAWHPVTKELWSTEHGPSSSAPYCCNDEVNKIVKGGNYGWPKYYGMTGLDSTYNYFNITQIKPVWTSGTNAKWAPGGAMFYTGSKLGSPWTNSLIFTGLGGIDKTNQALFRLQLSSDGRTPVQLDRLYKDTFGRLRDVAEGPDGAIYLATSNLDGRGSNTYGADKIIRLKPTGSTTPAPAPPPPAPTPGPVPVPSGQGPYTTPINLPGKLEAENYDKGGEGVAYHDTDAQNQGGQYRTDAVDVESNQSGGYNVGFISPGEWLEFTTKISTTGKYDLTFRVATAAANSGSWTLKDGNTVLAKVDSANTGGWYAWKDITVKDVSLSAASSKILRLESSGSALNLDYVNFNLQSAPVSPAPPPAPSTPTTPLPPIKIPDANNNTPVPIPTELPARDDGTIVGDFNGDGLNDIVRDANSDGSIDPSSEIVINGAANRSLTDTSQTPLVPEDYSDYVYDQDELNPNATKTSTVTFHLGESTEVKVPKPVAYSFIVAQGVAVAGIGTYLLFTKIALFAGIRARLGL